MKAVVSNPWYASEKRRNREPYDNNWSRSITIACLLLSLQNWVAYETLENAAKLNSNQQIINFANDELPKPAHHNAFCRVRIPI